MRVLHEILPLHENGFSMRIFSRSSKTDYIFAHPHWHDAVEILYVLKGEGQEHVNEAIFHFSAGDIVLIPGGAVHATYTNRDVENEMLVFVFQKEMLFPVSSLSPERSAIISIFEELELPRTIKDSDTCGIILKDILLRNYREFTEKKDAWEMFIRAGFIELTGALFRFYKNNPKRVKSVDDQRAKAMLSQTFELINANYAGTITLEQAAEASHLSVSHFCRLFRAYTGRTFKDYLDLFRVDRALEIFNSHRTLTEIAAECGFGSVSSFIRVFKKLKGAAPNSLRKNRIIPRNPEEKWITMNS